MQWKRISNSANSEKAITAIGNMYNMHMHASNICILNFYYYPLTGNVNKIVAPVQTIDTHCWCLYIVFHINTRYIQNHHHSIDKFASMCLCLHMGYMDGGWYMEINEYINKSPSGFLLLFVIWIIVHDTSIWVNSTTLNLTKNYEIT